MIIMFYVINEIVKTETYSECFTALSGVTRHVDSHSLLAFMMKKSSAFRAVTGWLVAPGEGDGRVKVIGPCGEVGEAGGGAGVGVGGWTDGRFFVSPKSDRSTAYSNIDRDRGRFCLCLLSTSCQSLKPRPGWAENF